AGLYSGGGLLGVVFTSRMPVTFNLLFSPWNAGGGATALDVRSPSATAVFRKDLRFTLVSGEHHMAICSAIDCTKMKPQMNTAAQPRPKLTVQCALWSTAACCRLSARGVAPVPKRRKQACALQKGRSKKAGKILAGSQRIFDFSSTDLCSSVFIRGFVR